MSGKYQKFNPGEYMDWEKTVVEERFAIARGEAPIKSVPVFPGMGGNDAVLEYDLLKFNNTWDPYNPLFNNKEYAMNAGYPGVPAWPCFKHPLALGMMALTIPMDMPDAFYYANDGSDIRYLKPIYAGDAFTNKTDELSFEDVTVPGSDLRAFIIGGSSSMYNSKGELVATGNGTLRNSYRKIIDGSPKPSFSENMAEWVEYFPPAHYTTDEEWEYINELWDKEYIRGKEKLYWEDVKTGDEPTWTCSGPVSYMDMVSWHGSMVAPLRAMRNNHKIMYRDQYGIFLPDYSLHYGNRNISNSRMVFFNNTACMHIVRMITNYIGDAGFVTRVCWRFKQLFKEMWVERAGGEFLDKVPYMKGKECTVHGSEGDTVIAKGYVTDKYINEQGEHIIDLVCWGETLDNRIIQVVAASARLPSKNT